VTVAAPMLQRLSDEIYEQSGNIREIQQS
jgi:hypothetical protein